MGAAGDEPAALLPSFFLFRRMNKKMAAPIRPSAATPPTAPPAIAPTLVFFFPPLPPSLLLSFPLLSPFESDVLVASAEVEEVDSAVVLVLDSSVEDAM